MIITHIDQNKNMLHTKNKKMENNESEKVRIKNLTFYNFDDVIKFEDFNSDNILIHEKSHEIF